MKTPPPQPDQTIAWVHLDLGDTPITDAGLNELIGHRNLMELNLTQTETTEDGRNELQKFLPNLKIKTMRP